MKYFSFLDNIHVNIVIIIILILYNSQLFTNINKSIENLYKYNFIKLLILLLITFIASKDTNIAILLGISYIISLNNVSIEKFGHNSYNAIIYYINQGKELSQEDMNYILDSEPKYKNHIFTHLFRENDKKLESSSRLPHLISGSYPIKPNHDHLDNFDKQIMNLINSKKKKKYITIPDFHVARGVKITNYSYPNSKYNSPEEYAQNKFFNNL
jgi:hypothetical protein